MTERKITGHMLPPDQYDRTFRTDAPSVLSQQDGAEKNLGILSDIQDEATVVRIARGARDSLRIARGTVGREDVPTVPRAMRKGATEALFRMQFPQELIPRKAPVLSQPAEAGSWSSEYEALEALRRSRLGLAGLSVPEPVRSQPANDAKRVVRRGVSPRSSTEPIVRFFPPHWSWDPISSISTRLIFPCKSPAVSLAYFMIRVSHV